jgi:hypothetical protein
MSTLTCWSVLGIAVQWLIWPEAAEAAGGGGVRAVGRKGQRRVGEESSWVDRVQVDRVGVGKTYPWGMRTPRLQSYL